MRDGQPQGAGADGAAAREPAPSLAARAAREAFGAPEPRELPGRDATPRVPPPDPREAQALARALAAEVKGEVRFDAGSRALYAADLSMYRQVPIGVVIPRDVDDVAAALALCRERGVPVLGRGCGTSLAGQCCNVAVVFDFSKYMHRIAWLDPDRRLARVEPGVIHDALDGAAKEYGLAFAPDPATHAYCTLGGQIGNNSCGTHSVMGGRTVDNVESLDVLTYDGLRMEVGPTPDDELERIARAGGRRAELYAKLRGLRDRYAGEIRARFPKIPRRVSGYCLDELLPERGFHVARSLVGHEGTCALVLGATVRLVHMPPAKVTIVLAYEDMFRAADDVPLLRDQGPLGIEAIERHVVENLRRKGSDAAEDAKLLPEAGCWLLVEIGDDTPDAARRHAEGVLGRIRGRTTARETKLLADPASQAKVWEIRKNGVGASRVPNVEDAWPSWEDAAVAPERLGAYLRDFAKLTARFGYAYTIYGHFGDGCVHARITFDVKTPTGLREYRRYMEAAADLVVHHGGSLSGEHGDGQARGELLPRMYGEELVRAFREFKGIWDPAGRMNPGKKIDPYPLDTNIRYGPERKPIPVQTWFRYPDDEGSFAKATERCFGVGKCRELGGGTMCPSFRATRDEEHTTRGRAHLLFEMMEGDVLERRWRSEHVKEALDLCLACKGCKHDCPVSVDMATYKAEFLAHYYQGRLRPRAAYALGLVQHWARLAELAPGVANAFTRLPVLSELAKALADVAPERTLPGFAPQTFRRWFARRPRVDGAGRRPVLLWPDTFNDHFHPGTARSAVEALEAAGYAVELPRRWVCCGRPLYDYGMLDRAKALLRRDLDVLRPALDAGTPIVFLEPSCASVFRDELRGLFPADDAAGRAGKQAVLLAELLERTEGYAPPRLEREAILHGHCHHKAVLGGIGAEERLLARMGVSARAPDTGCCGMAGSFGFEREKYDVSMKIGEHVLLPEIRRTPLDALVVADGFSCREQIESGSERRALHLADVLAMALRHGPAGPPGPYPERELVDAPASASALGGAVAGAVGLGLAAVLVQRLRARGGRRDGEAAPPAPDVPPDGA